LARADPHRLALLQGVGEDVRGTTGGDALDLGDGPAGGAGVHRPAGDPDQTLAADGGGLDHPLVVKDGHQRHHPAHREPDLLDRLAGVVQHLALFEGPFVQMGLDPLPVGGGQGGDPHIVQGRLPS
jgi:hypothetical protein